jgi:hypothetical protein
VALLPPFFLDAVVAIGVGDDVAKRQWIGTGFLFGLFNQPKTEGEKESWQIWLVTNKHVLNGLKKIYVKFNSASGQNSKDYAVTLIAKNGRPYWVGHPKPQTDVAVISVPAGLLQQEGRQFSYFMSNRHVSFRSDLQANQITEGDRVFALGFPMGLVDQLHQYVICRGGVVARIRSYIDKKADDFLVDATVFPGNSGGPVILCPSSFSIQGTKQVTKAELIGVIKSYVPYSDLAVSNQTRKARIIFEENSGLSVVEGVDAILETIKLANRRFQARAAQVRHQAKKKATAATTQPSNEESAPEGTATQPPFSNPVRRQ